jgi:hypothetical protein
MDASISNKPASQPASASPTSDASLSLERSSLTAEEFLSLTKDIASKDGVYSLPADAARQAISLGLIEKLHAHEVARHQQNIALIPSAEGAIKAAKLESDEAYKPYSEMTQKKYAYQRTLAEIEVNLKKLEDERLKLGESNKSTSTKVIYFLGSLLGACDSIHTQIRKNSAALVSGVKSRAEAELALEGALEELKPKEALYKAQRGNVEKLESERNNLYRDKSHFQTFKVIGDEAFRVTALGKDAAKRLTEVGSKSVEDLSHCLGVMAKEEAAVKVVAHRLKTANQVIEGGAFSKWFSVYQSSSVLSIIAASLPGDLKDNASKVKEALSVFKDTPIPKEIALSGLCALAASGRSLNAAKEWFQEGPAFQLDGMISKRLAGPFFFPSMKDAIDDKVDALHVLGFIETALTEPETISRKVLELSQRRLTDTKNGTTHSVSSYQIARDLKQVLFPGDAPSMENCNSSRERVSRLLYLDFQDGRGGNPLGSEEGYLNACTLLVHEEMGLLRSGEPSTLRVAVSLLEPLLFDYDRAEAYSGSSGDTNSENERMKIEIAIALSEQARREYLQRTSPSIMPSSLFGPYYGN